MAPKCEACGKTDVPLKQCAKCKSVQYCNRDCQKGDWKTHKRTCTFLAAAIGTEASEPSRSKRSDSKPFTAIFHGNFLHDRSKEDTYKILIDVVRMRQQDCLKLEGAVQRRRQGMASLLTSLLRHDTSRIDPCWSSNLGGGS